jgi:hypothetical protein
MLFVGRALASETLGACLAAGDLKEPSVGRNTQSLPQHVETPFTCCCGLVPGRLGSKRSTPYPSLDAKIHTTSFCFFQTASFISHVLLQR